MHSISWAQPAIDDLLEMVDFFNEKQEPEVGADLVARLYRSAERLAAFPHSGRKGLVPDTRGLVLPHLPFFLVHQVSQSHIAILRVMHSSRLWTSQDSEK